MNKGFMPIVLLVPERNMKKFENYITNEEHINDDMFKEIALNQLAIEKSKWIFLCKANVTSLNVHILPFNIKSELEHEEFREKRSFVDYLFKGLLETVFKEESDYDFNEFNPADQSTLIRFMNTLSFQFSIRYENAKNNRDISYLKNEDAVVEAINEMTDNLTGDNPKPINDMVSVVDVVPISASIEELIQDFYDRYDHELCSFTFGTIFKLSYTSDALMFSSKESRMSMRENPLAQTLALIGHMTGVSIFEPDTEALSELNDYTTYMPESNRIKDLFEKAHQLFNNEKDPVKLRENARKMLEFVTGKEFDDDMFDNNGSVKNPEELVKFLAESFDPDEMVSFLEEMGAEVVKVPVESPEDISAILDKLRNQMSPEEFSRFEKRMSELIGDDFISQSPKFLN